MALNISLDRIIPVTEARARLREIIEQTRDDQFWVLTWRGSKPRSPSGRWCDASRTWRC